ncbi:oxidoreductase domain-containing protein [Colletotrichum incanum]|uniref:Oxidoreductase domain-containing protein n=1 Tax=Colletotrichum incanum TaxID=1573173 RepID=A0A161VUD0_COLIC|nr:oxidoreductase domain-containing protein [Colletotrichum incanum]OHW94804.1 oxidoreductase domain-containing protein [Colletotrichum incanum]
MSTIKVGIVGYGFAAKNFHLPFITANKDYEVIAILQRAEAPSDPSSAPSGSHCKVDIPNIRHYRNAEDFFADHDTQLIVVATHTDTHALYAELALRAGKHVIVDKPFARSSEEADRIIQLASSKGLILTCFQNRRWDGDFQTLRKLIKEDALGEIKEAEIHYDFESPPWLASMTKKEYAPGDGMAFGLGTHSIDQAIGLFGRPKSVTGFFRSQRGIESEVEDSFTIILQYDGPQKDLLVTVKTSVTTPMAQQLKHLVRGTKGSWLKFQQRSTCPQEEQIAEGRKPLEPGFGEEPAKLYGTLTTYKEFDGRVQRFDEATKKYIGKYPSIVGNWLGVYENLAGAINGKAELEVKATQSRDAIRIIELARESHDTGATVTWK